MGCHTWFYRNKKEFENTVLDCEYHDLFRIGGYPETLLHSYDETIKFIKENDCKTYDYTNEKIKEFWNKYPNGVIDFG